MKKLFIGINGLILVILVALFATKTLDGGEIHVQTAVIELGPVAAYVTATGNVINREELTINSPIMARVEKLGAAEGDRVARGRLLVSLDSREYLIGIDKAREVLKFAERNEAEAKRDWRRLQQIFAVGGESRKSVEDAELRWQAMQKEVRLAKQEMNRMHVQQENFRLVAPVGGTITARIAREGEWIRPGDALYKLAPAGGQEIEVKLDAADSTAAVVGKNVVASCDAFPGKEWREKLTWVASATSKEGAANSLGVRISLGRDAPSLVLGQQVDVRISTVSRSMVLKAPSGAVISRQGKPAVAIIMNGRVHFIPVVTGIEDLTHTEIKGDLKAGQQIILPVGKSLHEGDKVKIAADQAAS